MSSDSNICFTPENASIVGVATRVHIYVQCFLIVLVSVIVRVRGLSPSLVRTLWRLQAYTAIAFAIGAIYGRLKGQLSVFDTVAAYHIFTLFFWGAIVGWKTRKAINDTQTPSVKSGGLWRRRIVTEHLLPLFFGVVNMGVGLAVTFTSRCDNSTKVVWRYMFGATAIVNVESAFPKDAGFVWGFLVAPIALFFFVPLLFNFIIPCCTTRSSFFGVFLYPSIYLFLFVEEVAAIEMSIAANRELDKGAQNRWDFGQITALVLIMPYLEAVLDQIRDEF